jgi:hypothetical protein
MWIQDVVKGQYILVNILMLRQGKKKEMACLIKGHLNQLVKHQT